MIQRERILERIRPFYESDLIKVVIGLRRSGKSVLLQQIIEELKESGVGEEQILSVNYEDFQYASITKAESFYDFVSEKHLSGKKQYLFFDEIQMVEGFERVINSFRATWDVRICTILSFCVTLCSEPEQRMWIF